MCGLHLRYGLCGAGASDTAFANHHAANSVFCAYRAIRSRVPHPTCPAHMADREPVLMCRTLLHGRQLVS